MAHEIFTLLGVLVVAIGGFLTAKVTNRQQDSALAAEQSSETGVLLEILQDQMQDLRDQMQRQNSRIAKQEERIEMLEKLDRDSRRAISALANYIDQLLAHWGRGDPPVVPAIVAKILQGRDGP